MVTAMQNITDVVHDVRTNRNFSRRVKEGSIEEFHQFGEDFNSLLDEMEEWQLKLQAKNAQLLRTAMHDPFTGLANRAAFRNSIAALMNDPSAKQTLPCSSSMVITLSLSMTPGDMRQETAC
jgi:PleD family two-component response regulator